MGQRGREDGRSQLNSHTMAFREKEADRAEAEMWAAAAASNLSEEVVPQNVFQVGSVLWNFGQEVRDELFGLW